MEKILNQSEIDALFRAARGDGLQACSPSNCTVERWDPRQAGLLRQAQLQGVSHLYEDFARNLTGAVSGYLRERFDVTLVAVEQLAYRDLLARFADPTCYASFSIRPADTHGVLHIDLGLALRLVDLLLGGPGEAPQSTRGLTDIEAGVLDGIGRLVCQELSLTSGQLGVEADFERLQPLAQMMRLMAPEEKTLTLTFDVAMSSCQAGFNVVFPSAVTSGLLRKLRTQMDYQRTSGTATHQDAIAARLLQSSTAMDLATEAAAVNVAEIVKLRPGDVLRLRQKVDDPASLVIGGRHFWPARPVASGVMRAAQLLGNAEGKA